jgi:hypothetical protein
MLAPEAPVITTVPVSYKSIEVSWDNVSGANRYRVYRRGAEEDTYQLIEVTTRTSYIDTDLVTGKRYYYKVRACHRDGDTRVLSGYSAVRSATPRLSQPEISTETASYNSIEVSWNRISGASGYIVYRADSETGAYKKIARVKGGSKRSYTNKSLVTGKTYYYKVSAYRTAGGVTKYSWRSGSESAAGMHTIYYQGDPQWRFPSSVARKACVMTAYAIAINSMGVDATPRDVYKSNGCETMMDVCSLEENFGVKPVCALCSDSKYLSCFDGHKTYIANPSRNGLRAVKEALSRHPEGVILWFKRGSKSHAVVACLNIDGTIYFSDPGRKRDALLTFKDTWVYYAYRMNYGDIAEMIALDFE